MTAAKIELSQIEFSHYEQKIIDSLNLTIRSGEFVILIGPNGSGKSSLLKILNGLVKPNSGRVLIDDREITGQPLHTIARQISTLTQDLNHSTFSDLTVRENIQLASEREYGRQSRLNSAQEQELVTYLDGFNLSLATKLNVPAARLSGGQRQALALAMSFIYLPKVLLLDEHTSALDPKAAADLMELSSDHIRNQRLTAVMVTHNLDHALQYGSRIIALNHGSIMADYSGLKKAALVKSDLIELVY